MGKPIMSVATVKLVLLKSNPPQLVINASGFVTTSGWKNARLEPRFYLQFPDDGLQDFDFVADPPEDIAGMVISGVTAKPIEWTGPPAHVKGVRVHSKTNDVEAYIGTADAFNFQ